ncbi:helix-turn-helix transcriptional regulator [Desulfovibrio falkowii]|uniref:helix-turn-helix transcriptional regulator n=1 Tax=Desulfovibrio sp. WGS1351 TaxID=3366814 RepID=UPI00372D667D
MLQPSNTPTIPAAGFMRLSQVLKIIPIAKTAWYAGLKEGRFPQPIKLGPRARAYRVEDITALIERLGQKQDGEA